MTAKAPKPLTPREQAQVDAAVAKALANAPYPPDYVIERIATILRPVVLAQATQKGKKGKAVA